MNDINPYMLVAINGFFTALGAITANYIVEKLRHRIKKKRDEKI